MEAPASPFILILKITGTAIIIVAMYKMAQKFGIIESALDRELRKNSKKLDELLARITSVEFYRKVLKDEGGKKVEEIVDLQALKNAHQEMKNNDIKQWGRFYGKVPSLFAISLLNQLMINKGGSGIVSNLEKLKNLPDNIGMMIRNDIYKAIKNKPDK